MELTTSNKLKYGCRLILRTAMPVLSGCTDHPEWYALTNNKCMYACVAAGKQYCTEACRGEGSQWKEGLGSDQESCDPQPNTLGQAFKCRLLIPLQPSCALRDWLMDTSCYSFCCFLSVFCLKQWRQIQFPLLSADVQLWSLPPLQRCGLANLKMNQWPLFISPKLTKNKLSVESKQRKAEVSGGFTNPTRTLTFLVFPRINIDFAATPQNMPTV